MGRLCKCVLFALVLMAVLHNSSGRKSSGGKKTSTNKTSDKSSQGTKTQPTYPKQPSYPAAGSNPGYPNQQYPGKGGSSPRAGSYPAGYSPGGYPAGESYPVRSAGQPGGYPGGRPSIGGGYPNWNPQNTILSPRYGGSFGGGGYGMGGSPFSNTVKSMGYGPSSKSKGFAKKAMLAAGVGTMTGMAVGYGIGNFQRPDFQFRSPQEERQYNHYMYKHQGTRSKDKSNKGEPNKTSKQPSQTEQYMSYEQYMSTCMKRKDLLKEQDMPDSAGRKNIQRDEPLTGVAINTTYQGGPEKNDTASPTTLSNYIKASVIREEDDDTVSIVQIGYPALTEQMKARKCVEMYLVYSESFAEKRRNISSSSNNHNGHCVSGVLMLLTTSFMLLSST